MTSVAHFAPGRDAPVGSRRRRSDAVVLAVIALAYGLIWPVGDYAINDDWAYFRSLTELHERGRTQILDWNPMSLVGHLFWGLAFTKPFGLSFTVARISVVAMHLIESLMLLRLLRLFEVSEGLALGAVLALIFNPLHFVHAFSYMTDVPGLAWQVIAVYAYAKALLSGEPGDARAPDALRSRRIWFIAGSLAAGAGFLTRQSGILVPAALLLYCALFDRRWLDWRSLLAAFGPVTVVVVAFSVWYQWFHGPTAAYVESLRDIVRFAAHPPFADLPFISFTLLAYAGWFVIPLAVALPRRAYRLPGGAVRYGFLAAHALAVSGFVYFATENRIFPYLVNVVTPFGLYMNNQLMIGLRDVLWTKDVGLAIGALCIFSILTLLLRVVSALAPRHGLTGPAGNPPASDAASSGGGSTPRGAAVGLRFGSLLLGLELLYCFATAPILFDRHLLLVAPAAIVVFCVASVNAGSFSRLRYLVCLAPMALYSIATTHDLHAASRAAFQAGRDLLDRGVDPRQLIAGYAFDGAMTYDLRNAPATDEPPDWDKHWWRADFWKDQFFEVGPTEVDRFVVWPPWGWWKGTLSSGDEKKLALTCAEPLLILGRPPRYEILGRYPYRNWWPWKTKAICVLADREWMASHSPQPPSDERRDTSW